MKLSLGLSTRDYSVAGGAVAYDADAQAYFNANTTITSAADKNAINSFYLGLKSDGIYTKIKAMYLPIWGSATSCKWNLVNPLDTDAAFRLTFSTGWTFSSSGATPNGTSAYANTNLIPSVILSLNSTHLSFYSRTNNPASEIADIGSFGSNNNWTLIEIYNNLFYNLINQSVSTSNSSMTNSTGMFIGSRTASNISKSFKNNSIVQSYNTISNQMSNISLTIGAMNRSTTPSYYSNRQYAFASIGDGLTDTEASNFYTRVNTLMTYFGINVY